MEGNDIGVTYVARYAVRFEDLLMHQKVEEEEPRGLFKRRRKTSNTDRPSRNWVPNDMPMKSLLHFVNQLQLQVMVVTYLGDDMVEEIEKWLARKGAYVEAVSYEDVYEWAEDLRRNPEIKGYYTSDPSEQDIIGWQHVTVTRPSATWGV